ncbi:MAG: phosphatase PAP2 family protein [Bacteroidetes bacterium]|nr:phosphatase PAP2 family protein [Bacteroidota bacterium]
MNLKLTLLGIFFSINIFSQTKDSTASKDNFDFEKPVFHSKEIIVPATMMLAGVAINGNQDNSIKNQVKDWRNDKMPNFRTHIDDVLQFVPYISVYGLEMLGMKPEHDWKNQTAILVKSHIINLGVCYIIKKAVHDTRPDNTALSFPSGHTAEAFAGATMVSMEYGKRYKWVPYAAFGTASVVGAFRIANNRHYLSDVLFGAGLGILSTKLAYWTHQYKWNKNKTPTTWTDPLDGKVYSK